MKVTFITHSSYFVELDHCCLLFDYYQGDVPQVDKPLYVFASHSHGDHFSPAIFQLAQEEKKVHYLLSDDISPGRFRKTCGARPPLWRPAPSTKWMALSWPPSAPPTWAWPSCSSARASACTTQGT